MSHSPENQVILKKRKASEPASYGIKSKKKIVKMEICPNPFDFSVD
jgi:hypothetical protein